MNGSLNNPSKNRNKMFHNKLTRTEIILTVALTGVVTYLLYCKLTEEKIEVECGDPSCYECISEIQNFIDPSVDPCEDFHQFVCGNFLKGAYKKQISDILSQEELEFNNEIDAMVVNPIFSTDPEPIKTQKMFFHACANLDESVGDRGKKILDLIKQIGGWPLQENWNEKSFDWLKVLMTCRKLGLPFNWFLDFGLHVEEEINYLKISYPTLSNHSDIILRQSYVQYIVNNLVNKDVNVRNIIDFEQRLIKKISEQNSELTFNTIEELQTTNPILDWYHLLQNITEESFELTEDTLIVSNVDMMKFYQFLQETPRSTQASYIVWKIIEHFAPYILLDLDKEFNRISTLQVCKDKTRDRFPYISEIEYIKKYSTADARNSATELVDLIRQEFLNRMKELTWSNSTAGEVYFEKFNQTKFDIGLSFDDNQELLDDDFLEANYLHVRNLSLIFENSNIIEMDTERSKYYYHSLFSNINKTGIEPEKKDFLLQATNINVFYPKDLNMMIVPPSWLHGFLYDYKRPKYLNFGSFGTLIAKEFITYLQILTEDDKSVTNLSFEASNKCLEDDFLRIMSEKKIDSSSYEVAEEVLADILARDIAYTAYQSWVEANGEEIELPFLSYSPNQLFWIKSSVINCQRKITDVEDRGDFDLIVSKYNNLLSARHLRSFANDFKCDYKTFMNPKEKC